jgi:multiple sugar transport system permease protein
MAVVARRNPLMTVGKYAAILFYLTFALFPLYWLLKISITPDQLIFTEGTALWPTDATLENFGKVIWQTDFPALLLEQPDRLAGLGRDHHRHRGGGGLCLLALPLPGAKLVIALMLLTQMFPLLMIIAPIYKIVAMLGLLNSLSSLILVYTAFNIPFATFLMQSFFDGIPKDLEDAAMMDGCTRFQALRKVILPLTLPGLGATLGFIFTAAWSEVLFALMLIRSEDSMTFPVGMLTFVSKFSVDWGQMMAAGVLALIPSCLFFIFIQRYLVQGLTSGAVKG